MFITFGFTCFFMPLCCSSSSRPVLQLANINLAKIILQSCLAKQTVRVHPISTETKLMVGSRTHWLSSAIHSYCLSRFVAAVTWPAFSFASACRSCSSFLIATSASEATCFLALITSSRSCSSVSKCVSVARSSCRRRSASPCSSYRHNNLHVGGQRGGLVSGAEDMHLALRDLVRERFELLAHLVDPGRGIG